ncbi:hypothetical protein V5O48_017601, partial [Marasmius crinis-equi]
VPYPISTLQGQQTTQFVGGGPRTLYQGRLAVKLLAGAPIDSQSSTSTSPTAHA